MRARLALAAGLASLAGTTPAARGQLKATPGKCLGKVFGGGNSCFQGVGGGLDGVEVRALGATIGGAAFAPGWVLGHTQADAHLTSTLFMVSLCPLAPRPAPATRTWPNPRNSPALAPQRPFKNPERYPPPFKIRG